MSPVDAAAEPAVRFNFENTYARLPERFFARVNPTPVAAPRLIKLNAALARTLGLDPDALASPEGVEVLAGNRVAAGSEPLAEAYAGHQFGNFVPQLGDGRANLLGEVVARDGRRYDIQLKGSGPTPFSRRGDGRAGTGPVLREYLVSEAMTALGVPSTRALAAVATGERVFRERVLPGAVLTRVAASHLRVGTFQYFAARRDTEAIRILGDYAIARHYADLADKPRKYRALLDAVITRQAKLVAQWMALGFIHGVMNTDNTSISGETIDYGPCAFMEAYNPDQVFSSIDINGRYAYANQPSVLNWNMARLAESLLPLLQEEEGSDEAAISSANEALTAFAPQYGAAYLAAFRRKLGLATEQDGDSALLDDLLTRMAANKVDFTLFFSLLADAAEDGRVRDLFMDAAALESWEIRWRERLAAESRPADERLALMRGANPFFIPRNHLVEEVLAAATDRGDLAPFEELLEVVTNSWEKRSGFERYSTPARPEQCVTETFCGT